MEVIDDLQDSNIVKLNKDLLLRYLGTGVFFWIALVNLVRIVDNLFKLFILPKIESLSSIFWLSELSNLFFFFLFSLFFVRILKRYSLSHKRTFVSMITTLSLIYIVSLVAIYLIKPLLMVSSSNDSKIMDLYTDDWYILFLSLNLPIKLLIIGLLFFKKQKSTNNHTNI